MMKLLKSKKFWKRFILFIVVLPIILFSILLLVIYSKQDALIQSEVAALNEGHKGKVSIGDVHLEPFDYFPYISIKVDDVKVYENKENDSPVILDVEDIYIGFDIWDIVKGNFDIQSLIVENGFFNIVLHKDGSLNIENSLATTSEADETSEPLDIHLKSIKLLDLDIHKLDEETKVDVETFVFWANGGFESGNGIINSHIDSEFELNIIADGDTTYIHHKHFEFHTDLSLVEETGVITFQPSGITMEHGDFDLEGTIDTKNDMIVNLDVKGTKPNFDMLIAFAPADVVPVLERYKNAGNIYFNANLSGPTIHGQMPFIDAKFGASEAYLENTIAGKKMDNMGFKGHFTNGEKRDLSSMEFSLLDMTARLEKGEFLGAVVVKNFEEPEIDMQLDANFDLDFLAGFLNLKDIEGTKGTVDMHMKFHDIIDLDNPEHALKDLNQAYYSELTIKDLSLSSSSLPASLEKLNMHLIMEGKEAKLDLFDLKMGQSDIQIGGYVSNLPALVHHTNIPIDVHFDVKADKIDITELTKYSEKDSTGVDEQIEDLSVGISFKSTAKEFTESKYLPRGEFFIDSLHAQLKHYPHELHDFHTDILIDDRDLRIVDFTGFIDKSDFHFNGLIHDYGFWFKDTLNGDVDLDITFTSEMLKLEDIFSYQGENFVPADYRHEELDKLKLHVNSSMHYKDSNLHSIDIDLDKFDAKMKVHPMRFEDFNGRVHYEDDHIVVEKFHAKMGRTVFNLDMNYYLGEDETIKKRDNLVNLKANYIDFDQLFNFNLVPPKENNEAKEDEVTNEHEDGFNLYELPFTDMEIKADVGHFIYHRIDLQNINAKLRTTHNHYIYIDTLMLNAAGGSFNMSGYFNGSDAKHIYLKPNLHIKNADIDKLMFKFENFGQDALVSDNIHGKLNADITGNIRVYPDFVPNIDQSEIHMDVQVLKGSLVNYEPMLLLSDYMGDKDLTNIKFDTLSNHMDFTNGLLTIPNMSIESTLGHYEISGTHDMEQNIEYFVRIPWRVIKDGSKYKLFGKKDDSESSDEDEIVKVDPNSKTKYLNLKIVGTVDDYKIRMGKDKKGKK